MSAFRKEILDNGLTLVMENHPHVRGLSVGLWVKVGSGLESPVQNGISHFTEHMVFKGTDTRSPLEIAAYLESLGGELNAFTEREYTCYHATVLKEHLDPALEILSDIVIHPTFPKVEIEREKKVLLQEMAMAEETPEDWILTLLLKTVWANEPMGMPILGTRKSVQGITKRHLNAFFDEHYRPENMVMSVAGNLNFDEVRDRVEYYMSNTRKQNRLPLSKMPVRYRARRRAQVMDTDQLHLMLAFESVGLRSPKRFEALLLSLYLGGGMSSRLFQEVREKAALAYSVDCDSLTYTDEGLLTFYVAMGHRSLSKCLGIISKEVQRLVDEDLPENELQSLKGQIRGMLLLSADQMEHRQESIGRNEILFGRYIPIEESIQAIEAVGAADLRRFAGEIFRKEKESAVTLAKNRYKSSQLTLF
ncbi:MAG: pitrilysin family protein [Bdellovibrionota bacterium]